jgi:GT2 family glycosyltransferase
MSTQRRRSPLREARRAIRALVFQRLVILASSRSTDHVPAPIAGELRVRGRALAASAIRTITVATHDGQLVEAALERPRRHAPYAGGRMVAFEARVTTAGWLAGRHRLTIEALTASDRHASLPVEIDWQPSLEELEADRRSGRVGIWVGEPRLAPGKPLGAFISVRGWTLADFELAALSVELEGARRVNAFHGSPVEEATPDGAAGKLGFAAILDVRSLEPGRYRLAVTATGANGARTTRAGVVTIDPGERHRLWLASRRPRAAPRGVAAERLQVCALGVDPASRLQEALESLADGPHDAVLFVDADDRLAPEARDRFEAALATNPASDVVYCDHDLIDADGGRCDPFPKPGWSPELLLSFDYVASPVALGPRAARAALEVGTGPPPSLRALLLRLVDASLVVTRIPESLSTRPLDEARPDAAGEAQALRELAARRGRALEIGERDEPSGVRELKWRSQDEPAVSIVIPTTGREEPLAGCLVGLERHVAHRPLEVILVDSGGGAAEVAAGSLGSISFRVLESPGKFNFSVACNLGASAASGDLLLFLNDDVMALAPGWLGAMVGQAQLPGVGVVGARLLFPSGLVQHAGLVLDRLDPPPSGHFVAAQFAYLEPGSSGPHGLVCVPRDCSAVTGACMMIRAGLLSELGGWDDGFRIHFGDVDLCLRARETGHRVLVEPRATLVHYESTTLGYAPHDRRDRERFLARWSQAYAAGDPWYHPGCTFGRDWELRASRGPSVASAPRWISS